MEEMRFYSYILQDIKFDIQKLIELVYQLQLFNKKIVSTPFKTLENAFIMRQNPALHNVYFLKIYKR